MNDDLILASSIVLGVISIMGLFFMTNLNADKLIILSISYIIPTLSLILGLISRGGTND